MNYTGNFVYSNEDFLLDQSRFFGWADNKNDVGVCHRFSEHSTGFDFGFSFS